MSPAGLTALNTQGVITRAREVVNTNTKSELSGLDYGDTSVALVRSTFSFNLTVHLASRQRRKAAADSADSAAQLPCDVLLSRTPLDTLSVRYAEYAAAQKGVHVKDVLGVFSRCDNKAQGVAEAVLGIMFVASDKFNPRAVNRIDKSSSSVFAALDSATPAVRFEMRLQIDGAGASGATTIKPVSAIHMKYHNALRLTTHSFTTLIDKRDPKGDDLSPQATSVCAGEMKCLCSSNHATMVFAVGGLCKCHCGAAVTVLPSQRPRTTPLWTKSISLATVTNAPDAVPVSMLPASHACEEHEMFGVLMYEASAQIKNAADFAAMWKSAGSVFQTDINAVLQNSHGLPAPVSCVEVVPERLWINLYTSRLHTAELCKAMVASLATAFEANRYVFSVAEGERVTFQISKFVPFSCRTSAFGDGDDDGDDGRTTAAALTRLTASSTAATLTTPAIFGLTINSTGMDTSDSTISRPGSATNMWVGIMLLVFAAICLLTVVYLRKSWMRAGAQGKNVYQDNAAEYGGMDPGFAGGAFHEDTKVRFMEDDFFNASQGYQGTQHPASPSAKLAALEHMESPSCGRRFVQPSLHEDVNTPRPLSGLIGRVKSTRRTFLPPDKASFGQPIHSHDMYSKPSHRLRTGSSSPISSHISGIEPGGSSVSSRAFLEHFQGPPPAFDDVTPRGNFHMFDAVTDSNDPGSSSRGTKVSGLQERSDMPQQQQQQHQQRRRQRQRQRHHPDPVSAFREHEHGDRPGSVRMSMHEEDFAFSHEQSLHGEMFSAEMKRMRHLDRSATRDKGQRPGIQVFHFQNNLDDATADDEPADSQKRFAGSGGLYKNSTTDSVSDVSSEGFEEEDRDVSFQRDVQNHSRFYFPNDGRSSVEVDGHNLPTFSAIKKSRQRGGATPPQSRTPTHNTTPYTSPLSPNYKYNAEA